LKVYTRKIQTVSIQLADINLTKNEKSLIQAAEILNDSAVVCCKASTS